MYRHILAGLLVSTLTLPILIVILLATARLLAAMQDAAGSLVLERLSLAMGLLWIANLVALVILQALATLGPPPSEDGE